MKSEYDKYREQYLKNLRNGFRVSDSAWYKSYGKDRRVKMKSPIKKNDIRDFAVLFLVCAILIWIVFYYLKLN